MKPIEHPDFFRRPPPPGQSRESSIVLDGEGRFWHAGQLVTHRGLHTAFASWIRRHPDDGRYILCNGYDWTYFGVEDVPCFVTGVRAAPDGLLLALFDGSEELLEPGSLRVGERDALYVDVKGGAFEARFSPAAQAALVPFVVEGVGGAPALQVGDRVFSIAARRRGE